jgi:hypothetical protein
LPYGQIECIQTRGLKCGEFVWKAGLFMPIAVTSRKFYQFCLIAGTLFATVPATARPEYAIRYGINRCTVCHYSPAGGGARNLNGKYFGAFGDISKSWIRQQDYVGAEMKVLYYRPQKALQTKGGLGIMEGDVWASVPLDELSGDGAEMRLIAEQNLGGFGAGPRQWYARWAFAKDTETSWIPQYVLLGRIIPAFGLMTDEHRTYVRMQSGTPWNTGFDTGALLSANPMESIHYDLAIVNGQKNSGQGLATDEADSWGSVANLRWIPSYLPFGVGASGSWYAGGPQTDAATALSLYAMLSVHRLSGNRVPVTVSAEFVQAKNWNDTFTGSFVGDSAYAATVSHSTSKGFYALVEWEVHRRWIVQYKFDQLVLDRDFPADAYQRHGLGLKYYFANNMWALMRFEKAYAHHPGESDGLKTGDLNAAWGLINISI